MEQQPNFSNFHRIFYSFENNNNHNKNTPSEPDEMITTSSVSGGAWMNNDPRLAHSSQNHSSHPSYQNKPGMPSQVNQAPITPPQSLKANTAPSYAMHPPPNQQQVIMNQPTANGHSMRIGYEMQHRIHPTHQIINPNFRSAQPIQKPAMPPTGSANPPTVMHPQPIQHSQFFTSAQNPSLQSQILVDQHINSQPYTNSTVMPSSNLSSSNDRAISPNSQEIGDETPQSRTLWVGDIDGFTDEAYLLGLFAHIGDIVQVKVIRDKLNGMAAGYGFVEFATHATAKWVLETHNGKPLPVNNGKTYRLNWASYGINERRNETEYSLFVGDLAPDVTDFQLQQTFLERYQSVKSAKVVTDSQTGLSRRYGFVRFTNEDEMNRALIEMQGQCCCGRPMRINHATPRKQDQGTSLPTPISGVNPAIRGVSPIADATAPLDQATAPPVVPESADPHNTTVFIGNLDPMVSEEDLRTHFSDFGDMIYVKIPVGKGCGFVQFVNRNSAEAAFERHGSVLGRQKVRLSWGRSSHRKNNSTGGSFPGLVTPIGVGSNFQHLNDEYERKGSNSNSIDGQSISSGNPALSVPPTRSITTSPPAIRSIPTLPPVSGQLPPSALSLQQQQQQQQQRKQWRQMPVSQAVQTTFAPITSSGVLFSSGNMMFDSAATDRANYEQAPRFPPNVSVPSVGQIDSSKNSHSTTAQPNSSTVQSTVFPPSLGIYQQLNGHSSLFNNNTDYPTASYGNAYLYRNNSDEFGVDGLHQEHFDGDAMVESLLDGTEVDEHHLIKGFSSLLSNHKHTKSEEDE